MAGQPTEQQIIQYILNGGDVQDLLKSKNVGWKNLVTALVKNPEIIAAAQQQAAQQTEGLDSFNPNMDYLAGTQSFDVNPITQKYTAMGPKIAQLAQDYFGTTMAMGNNPTLSESLDAKFKQDAIDKYGLDEKTAQGIVTALSTDRDKWTSEEQAYQIRKQKAQYGAFQKQRNALKLEQGQTPQEKVVQNLTGFGELASLPSPKLTFEDVAKKVAAAEVAMPTTDRKKVLSKMVGSGADQFIGSKQDQILKKKSDYEKNIAAGQRSVVEKAFVEMSKKLAGKGGTPYTQAVKKLLPVIAAKKGKI